ncbi:hypothetical protein ACKZDW_02605 (plasmid) [Ralstonia syzygii subsp. celebesensis]|uniref:hypothetical protein n=1 Tax=Ralstonia syzygii TaxID=28097 RepID=UPI00387E097E
MNSKLKLALGALVFAGYTAAAIKYPVLMPGYLEYAKRAVTELTASAPLPAAPASAPAAAPAVKP